MELFLLLLAVFCVGLDDAAISTLATEANIWIYNDGDRVGTLHDELFCGSPLEWFSAEPARFFAPQLWKEQSLPYYSLLDYCYQLLSSL